MSLQKLGITYKKINKKLVFYINFRGEIQEIPPKIDELYNKCKKYTYDPAIVIIDYGVYSEGGKDIDICFPVSKFPGKRDIKTKKISEAEVLSINHYGSHDSLTETAEKLFNYLHTYGVLGTSWLRLIYYKYDLKSPNENKIEIQVVLHNWDQKLAKNIDRVLGVDVRKEVMIGREKNFTIESTLDDKVQWIKNVLTRLDKLANDYEKYDILSCCAHEFSQKRIDKLKTIYEDTGDIDEILKEMDKEFAWYEGQKREGNTICVQKIPYNREGYIKAKSLEEKKKNYCHCSLVRNYLNENISPTFCNCGAGWYRQYWEGILGKPVYIKVLKTLIKGDDVCQFEISIPHNN